jgi:hypothetical protein
VSAEVAGWEVTDHPATNADPVVLRRTIATRIRPAMRHDWAAGLCAGLAETAGHTITIDTTAAEPQGSVHTLHTFTDRFGHGHMAATLARPVATGSDITCRITPMSRYAHELGFASPAYPEGDEVIVEAHITVHRGVTRGHGTILRRGDLGRIELPGVTNPTWARASALPGLLFTGCELGPRPRSGPLVVLVDEPSLTDLLTQSNSPQARDAHSQAAGELTRLARGLRAWWLLEWVRGVVPKTLAVDEAWHSAASATGSRLEVLDAGDAGLWRIMARVPEPLLADWEGDEEPVALCRTNATEVFTALVRLAV